MRANRNLETIEVENLKMHMAPNLFLKAIHLLIVRKTENRAQKKVWFKNFERSFNYNLHDAAIS